MLTCRINFGAKCVQSIVEVVKNSLKTRWLWQGGQVLAFLTWSDVFLSTFIIR